MRGVNFVKIDYTRDEFLRHFSGIEAMRMRVLTQGPAAKAGQPGRRPFGRLPGRPSHIYR
jgi:hypothetical protein